MLWLQGWEGAPQVAVAARRSWEIRNPGWVVQALDRAALSRFLPAAVLSRLTALDIEPEALSDLIRLELLHRYGGVWADATTLCIQALDSWLPQAMPQGFFAFDRPGPDRPLATWFLAAEQGSIIVSRWRDAAERFWQGRRRRGNYFWVYDLFDQICEEDPGVRDLWNATPRISAQHPFHFAPNATSLTAPPPDGLEGRLKASPAPVFKLTHKFDTPPGPGSLQWALCDFASMPAEHLPVQPTAAGALVFWYGSFKDNGTIGDQRALEALTCRLVGRGYAVRHVSAPIPGGGPDLPGATLIPEWQGVAAAPEETSVFVCGPILKDHPRTSELFQRFEGRRTAGISVSLMPEASDNRADPFTMVLARQGGTQRFGDIAVAAPSPAIPMRGRDGRGPGFGGVGRARPLIGLALRGAQHEYGFERCQHDRVNMLISDLAGRLDARTVMFENHLTRSDLTPNGLEAAYAACDLVVTTRFHGAVMSLRHGVPFIAIDQIEGGAKVWPLLSQSGWPCIRCIEDVTPGWLVEQAVRCLSGALQPSLIRALGGEPRSANQTLAALDRWLAVGQASNIVSDRTST